MQLQTRDIYKLTLIIRDGQYLASQGCLFGPSGMTQLLPMIKATYTSDIVRLTWPEHVPLLLFSVGIEGTVHNRWQRRDGSFCP